MHRHVSIILTRHQSSEFHVPRYASRFMASSWWIGPDARWVGGDFLKGDGTGSFSIYGDKFPVSARFLPFFLPLCVQLSVRSG